MSIFSRLFNKGQTSEDEKPADGTPPASPNTPEQAGMNQGHDRPSPSGARARFEPSPPTARGVGNNIPPPPAFVTGGTVPDADDLAQTSEQPVADGIMGGDDEAADSAATRVSSPMPHDLAMSVAEMNKRTAPARPPVPAHASPKPTAVAPTPPRPPSVPPPSPDDTTTAKKRPTAQIQGRINLMAIAKGGTASPKPRAPGPPKAPVPGGPTAARGNAPAPPPPAPGSNPRHAGASPEPPPIAHSNQTDPSDVRALFAELAANYMRPVREFIAELAAKPARRSWLEVCEPAIKSLRRSSEGMELSDLTLALDHFSGALSEASRAGGDFVDGPARDAILAAYARLVSNLPQAFALEPRETDAQAAERDAMIVHSVLLQVPGVTRAAVDKLYAAGLTSLDALFTANAEDMSATSGISHEVATRIVAKVSIFRAERESGRAATRTSEREDLARTITALRKNHADYERVADAWTEAATSKKRELRKLRAESLLKIKVLLARWGELERVHEIERLSFERKLEKLERYLKENAKSVPVAR